MVLPKGDQAAEQVRSSQQWAIGRAGSADRNVIATAGTCMPSIQHEFFRAQPGQPGLFI